MQVQSSGEYWKFASWSARLSLSIALASLCTTAPADAATDLEKCRVYNAKIKMNYAKCLEQDNLLVEKGKAAKGICDSKRTASLEKATAKFVTKLGVGAADCGIDTDTAAADQALQWLASGDGSLTAEQEAALAGTVADITSDNQAVCEAAGGTWENDACTPVAVGDRDCFREGLCGVDGHNYGAFAGLTISNSGCDETGYGTNSYYRGSFSEVVGSVSSFVFLFCD